MTRARRTMRSKIRGGWVRSLFGGRASTRVGLSLFARKHRRRRRTYR